MGKTIELSFNGVHNHKPTIKVLEELAMDEWRKTARRSHVPSTTSTRYCPPPNIIAVDQIINALNGMKDRLKLLEESMRGLGQQIDQIKAKIAKYDSNVEELESRVSCYECAE